MNQFESIVLAVSLIGLVVGISWLHNIAHRI